MSDEKKPELVKVTFNIKHRHGGVNYKAGESAEVTPRAAEKLTKLKGKGPGGKQVPIAERGARSSA